MPLSQDLRLPRWFPLRYHPEQRRLWDSPARYRVVPAGRQSGKTELAKRFIVKKALNWTREDGFFIAAAPTWNQARRIYWQDLRRMVPRDLILETRHSDLQIRLKTGTTIQVFSLDAPERIEGVKISGIVLDEFASCKPDVFDAHIAPALVHHKGWAWFIGVPEGRNHYYKLFQDALTARRPDWDGFHWKSAEIVDPSEVEAAKERMDPTLFRQEFEASFESYEGQAYHEFSRATHAKNLLPYNPLATLIIGFDFNVEPGVAVVCQEFKGQTHVIGEVWIPKHSNTLKVCRKLEEDWGGHQGRVILYGDATGGARGSAKVRGSDWDLIRGFFKEEWSGTGRWSARVPRSNPAERSRVNAVNCRLRDARGSINLLVDPKAAPNLVEDLEGVRILTGTAGELDKKTDPTLTHISDALGYYIQRQFPVYGETGTIRQIA